MFRRFRGKRGAAVLGSVLALGLAVAAYAYFTSSGSGTGSASVGSAGAFTVTFGTTTGGPLFPAVGSEVLPYTVTNPSGGGSQALTTTTATVAASGGNVTHSGAPVAGCLASWFTATNSPPAAGTLAPGGTATGSVTVTLTDSGTNQNACQGVSPDITVNAS